MVKYLVKSRRETLSVHNKYKNAVKKRSSINKKKEFKGFGKAYIIKRKKELFPRDYPIKSRRKK